MKKVRMARGGGFGAEVTPDLFRESLQKRLVATIAAADRERDAGRYNEESRLRRDAALIRRQLARPA